MRLASILLLLVAATLPAAARRQAPAGICLVALEPNSGDDEVGGIAHCGYATTCCSYILITPNGMRIEIPDNRFRGFVPLPTRESLNQNSPESELARLQAAAKRYPLAASSFSTQLNELRHLVANRQAGATPPSQPPTPDLRLAGKTYHDFQLRSLANGRATFTHRDGAGSLPLDSLSAEERATLTNLAAATKGS